MLINIDGEEHRVSMKGLSHDLFNDDDYSDILTGFRLQDDGKLILCLVGGIGELWQARAEGVGTSNSDWGDAPNGFEFCGSVTLGEF